MPKSVTDMSECGGQTADYRDDTNVSCGHLQDIHQQNASYPDYCRTLTIRDSSGQLKELVFPKALDLDRPKRARTTFSSEQLYRLEQEFLRNQYVVGRERTELAQRLALTETQVKVWFQNRRTKYKRDRDRDAETKHANAESAATCNILRMLQQRRPAVSGTPLGNNVASNSAVYAGQGLLRSVAPESVLRLPSHLYSAPFT